LYFSVLLFFFLILPPTTPIYTLSLHDALPISASYHPRTIGSVTRKSDRGVDNTIAFRRAEPADFRLARVLISSPAAERERGQVLDRKSTRLNSSHVAISYAVFCLKKKTINTI